MLTELLSINFLKSFSDLAHTTSWGKLFHGSTTLLVKKNLLASILENDLNNLNIWPLVWVVVEKVKKSESIK